MESRAPALRDLVTLRALLRRRSVTAAAHDLGVTQPAVSRTLRLLEESLGLRLFERRGGRIVATTEAEAMLPALDGVFAALDGLNELGAALREGAAGQVVVAAVPSIANAVLPIAIAAAVARHPRLRVGVRIGVTREVVTAVARGAAHVGLVHDILEDPLIAARELGAAHVGCVVRRDHPFAARRLVEARDLRDVPYASYPSHSPLSDRIAVAFEDVGEAYAPRVDAAASTTLCSIVASTGMPGLVEDYVLAPGWWPDLCVVPLAPPVPLRLRLLVPRRQPLSGAVATLAEACAVAVMQVLTRRALALTPGRPRRSRTGAVPPRARPTSGSAGGR